MANSYTRRINLYINGKEIKNQISDVKKAFYKAQNELARLTVGSEQYNKKLAEVGKLKSILDKHNSAIRETSKQWDKSTKAINKQNGALGKIVGSAKGLLPAFGWGAVIAGAVKGAKALFNMYTETAKARREAERLTGLSGEPLAKFTASVQATADTFNEDFSEVLVSTNNFAKTMGISAEDALDKINDGFIVGADSSGEFLDILKEYGPQFKAAGLSADQAIALISQQVTSGIYSDKGIDAIKEATISLREMTPATAEAINNIGLSSDVIQQQLRNGTISAFDAIQMISNRLSELPPQSSEVGTAIADIFRGAGEDAGLEYITMLGQAELSLENVKEKAGENAKTQERLLDANVKLKQAWGELMGTGTGTFTAIKATATELLANGIVKLSTGLKGVRDWFIELYNGSLPVRAGMQYMISSWITGFTIVKTAMKALWENLLLGGKLIKGVLTFDLDGIKNAFKEYNQNTQKAVTDNAKKVATTWKNAFERTINGKIKTGAEIPIPEPPKNTPAVSNQSSGSDSTTTTHPSSTEPATRTPAAPMAEMESFTDPRIEVEQTLTDITLEESKLRQQILNKEQKDAADRAAAELAFQQQKRDAYLSTLDTVIGVFGEESRIGKAALAAKQAWAIAETIINIAKGTALTAASTPFPANIPMIAGFIAQVAGLITTIKSAASTESMAEGGFAGYTGDGGKYQEAQLVQLHKGEYVVPQELMRLPAVQQIVSSFEQMRTNPATINSALPQMYTGGYAVGYAPEKQIKSGSKTTSITTAKSEADTKAMLNRATVAIESLLNLKIYTSIEDVNTAQKRYTDIQNTRGL